jgi:uncharacterized protein
MDNWMENIQGLTLKGQIRLPYTWWVGDVGSRFLRALRDEEKILGNHCMKCNTVYVPPRKNCGRCFKGIDKWVELEKEGVVQAHTIVRFQYPVQPAPAPFAYAVIKLDGADVGLVHIIKEGLDKLKNGVRVRALFKEDRKGHILDIDSFEII